MTLRTRFEDALARTELRLRVRLDRAANRMEDADPVDIAVARAGVRVLDAVDRATRFRARHRARQAHDGEPDPR